MATPAERLGLLMKAYGDSLRSCAEECDLDKTTIQRVLSGKTEHPDTLEKISNAFGVPMAWLQGKPDLALDFQLHVLNRPVEERIQLVWHKRDRVAFVLRFLMDYDSNQFSLTQIADRIGVAPAVLEGILTGGVVSIEDVAGRLSSEVGISSAWLETGLFDMDDDKDIVPNLVHQALLSLAQAVGAPCTEEELAGIAAHLI